MRGTSTTTLVFVLLVASFQDVVSFNMTIWPPHQRVGVQDNVTIMCRADVPLTNCQFTWWDVDEMKEVPHFLFERGMASESAFMDLNNKLVDYSLAGYRYAGRGLEHRECGIHLIGVSLHYRVISCRAKSRDGSWNYATMSLCSIADTPIDLDFKPEKLIFKPGDAVSILSTVNVNPRGNPLTKCKFRINGMSDITFDISNTRNNSSCIEAKGKRCERQPTLASGRDTRASYKGNGLQNGQCGITVRNISDSENGWLFFEAKASGGRLERRVVHLTVAKPTNENVTMDINTNWPALNETVRATCTVQVSLPAAEITWSIGNEILRKDKVDDSPAENRDDSAWRWDHEPHSISQTFEFQMESKYHNKHVECLVKHIAIPNPIRLKELIRFPNEQSFPSEPKPVKKVSCAAVPPKEGVDLDCRLPNGWGNPFRVNCSEPAEEGTVVIAACKNFYIRVETNSRNRIVCTSAGTWSDRLIECRRTGPSISVASPVTCPALSPTEGIRLTCRKNNADIDDCSRPLTPGTRVTINFACPEDLSPEVADYQSITCNRTGQWDKPLLACKAVQVAGCGHSRKLFGRAPEVINKPASYGEFPWHVAIYKLTSRGYVQVCSGSLIRMDTVITAASCLWKDRYNENFNSSLYKVVAGKIRRSYTTVEEHTQIREISRAIAPEQYTGRDTDYQVNIAVLTLSEPMDRTNYVNAVCVDWKKEGEGKEMVGGKEAFVPGWAFAEEDSPGEVLASVKMPFIEFEECNAALTPDLKRLFTGEKFCAGSTHVNEGFTMCDSDHGAGLVFYSENLGTYNLRGVTSVPFKPITNRESCYASRFGAFTLFSMFSNWVQRNMK